MSYTELVARANLCISQRPDLKHIIVDFVALAKGEIESGESEANECALAVESIDDAMAYAVS